MATLTFENQDLLRLAIHAERNQHRGYKGEDEALRMWLVGDQGVYLMTNVKTGSGANEIAYAVECNPNTVEDWWQVKRDTFGGDDGVEKFALKAETIADIKHRNLRMIIRMNAAEMTVSCEVTE